MKVEAFKYKILLGSGSPRRQELLRQMGYDFQVVESEMEEIFPSNLPIDEVAAYLAIEKSRWFGELAEDQMLITADTVVISQNKILGKPKDPAEAREMLLHLAGRTHQVMTGVCLRTAKREVAFTDVATVQVAEATLREIDFYLENYQPYDKAGSYGIQDWYGLTQIERLEGSFYTVMGLPTARLHQILRDWA